MSREHAGEMEQGADGKCLLRKVEAGADEKCLLRKVEAEADGMRLERYLRERMGFSRAQVRSMKFRENGLKCNGVRVRVSEILHGGDELRLLLEERGAASSHLEEAAEPVELLYEDEDVAVVWKEAGLVVHPSHGHYQDTLSNRLHAYFRSRGCEVVIRSIGRLDRDTSGIVVFAKNQVAAARLWSQKESGTFYKEYLAVCRGMVPGAQGEWRTIETPIGRMPQDLMKMRTDPGGRPAVTHYQVLFRDRADDSSALRLRIETGRTHQIRVHMASIGCPLKGDILYGSAGTTNTPGGSAGLCLCAWRTEFAQPFTREILRFERLPAFLPDGGILRTEGEDRL